MEFSDLRDQALKTLYDMPPMGKKARRRATAIINADPIWRHPFPKNPNLFARWARVLQIRAERQVRRYSPHDPNRIPR